MGHKTNFVSVIHKSIKAETHQVNEMRYWEILGIWWWLFAKGAFLIFQNLLSDTRLTRVQSNKDL